MSGSRGQVDWLGRRVGAVADLRSKRKLECRRPVEMLPTTSYLYTDSTADLKLSYSSWDSLIRSEAAIKTSIHDDFVAVRV